MNRTCVKSLLCGPWADLWPFNGLCNRFSPRGKRPGDGVDFELGLPVVLRRKIVSREKLLFVM